MKNRATSMCQLTKSRIKRGSKLCRKVLPVLIAGCFACGPAFANPSGAQVVSGHAAISSSGNVLNITNSPGAIINWNTFSINPGELTQFLQQNSGSSVLNRIVGQNPSQIFGTLLSNGKVYLINPNGILFGPNAQVNVGGLVASTLDIANGNFTAGKLNFNVTSGATQQPGSVVNQGSITTPSGGNVYLIAPQVQNNGIITSPQGEVMLAAGHSVQLFEGGDPNVQVVISAPTDQALNLGNVVAQGGKIGIYGALVSQDGIVSADSAVVGQNGEILFKSSQSTTLAGNSETTAQGNGNGHVGGAIYVLGPQVALTGNAQINASGQSGGGTVLIGGSAHGADPAIENATTTALGANTAVRADATQNGDGGKITVWSLDTTSIAGTISAQGGALSGNGGYIETSGGQLTVANGTKVTTAAAMGLAGTWLIDPINDFTIAATGGDMSNATLSGDLGTTSVAIHSSEGASPGSGNVNVNAPVAWSANTTLTLSAANNVNINANIAASGNTAGLVLNPNTTNGSETASGSGVYTLNNGASITLSGSNPSLTIAYTPYTVINSVGVSTDATNPPTPPSLQGVAASANLNGHFALGSNIDATATGNSDNPNYFGPSGFTPIGNGTAAFTGVFDGLGNTINGLTINNTTNTYAGLFGMIGSGAIVQNVKLTNASISSNITGTNYVGGLAGYNSGTINNVSVSGNVTLTGTATGNFVGGLVGQNTTSGTINNSAFTYGAVSGVNNVGGLAGANYGTINSSYAAGSVSGNYGVGGLVGYNNGSIGNSYVTGNITGTDNEIGGLAGINGSTGNIDNSYATGSVSGGYLGVGGLVGFNFQGTIGNSYATGNVAGTGNDVGGLVGLNLGTISSSYATGSVSGNNYVGGLVGRNSGSINYGYATGSVSGNYGVGGLVGTNSGGVSNSYWNTTTSGQESSAGGTGLTTAQMQSTSYFSGFNFTTTTDAQGNNWVMVDVDGSLNNAGGTQQGATFPMLASEYSTTINNAHQLQLMTMALGANYILGSNVNAAGTNTATTLSDVWSTPGGFVPVGNNTAPFTGTFNGQGNIISNLTINLPSTNYVGLFGYVNTGAVIQNVGLIGGSVNGNSYVGGLVGYNSGTISNSYTTGNVTATGNGTNTGNYVGGLVGYNYGTISNSYATGNVTATGNGTNTGNYVGGLVGYNSSGDTVGSISNSYATGNVTATGNGTNTGNYVGGLAGYNGGSINYGYSTGSVSGNTNVGGLVGYNSYGGSINNSYWNSSVNTTGIGGGNLTGATGLTTTQMQTASNFSNFNFTTATTDPLGNYWVMVDTDGSLNNAGGALGATFPMLASEYSTTINNAHQLQLMTMALGANYILGSNVNAAGTNTATTLSDVWSTPGGFVPVGNNTAPFTGTFNGQGNTIGNLTINLPSANNVGLFGYVNSGAVIQNVGLIGGSVNGNSDVGGLVGYNSYGGSISNSYATGSVNGNYNVGGLVGYNNGSIVNSYATGNVSGTSNVGGLTGYNSYGGSVSNSYATGSVNGNHNVGGLVGSNYGSIGNSNATGNVNGGSYGSNIGGLIGANYGGNISGSNAGGSVNGNYNVGGLVGMNTIYSGGASVPHHEYAGTGTYGAISASYATGSVSGGSYVGGLVGYNNSGLISNSYATGAVTGTVTITSSGNYVGGLVGENSYGSISNSYATGNVTGTGNYVGGLVGYNNGGNISNGSYASGSVSGASYVGGLVGYNKAAYGGGIISNSYAIGNVTGTGNYVGGLVGYNNGGNISSGSYASGSVSGASDVGGLVGKNNYGSISNSYATGNVTGTGNYVGGLVGYNIGGNISNGSYASGSVSGASYVGGLVGYNNSGEGGGTISNSYATGNVTGTGNYVGGLVGYNNGGSISSGSYASGSVSGASYVGGLVGKNSYGSISNSYATGNVTGTGNYVGGLVGYNNGGNISSGSYASGSVSGASYVGGLVGYNNSGEGSNTISNSYAIGAVTGTGTSTSSGNYVGGLVGYNNGGSISNVSYASGSVSGASYVGGLVGKNSYGSISNSYATGNVTDTGNYVGGLVGYNNGGSINNGSYASGSVSGVSYVGGLVGKNSYGSISNSYATGNVTGTGNYVGGLVGYNNGGNISSGSYASGSVSGASYVGGLVGYNNSGESGGTISNSYATGAVTGTGTSTSSGNYVGGLVGYNNGGSISSSHASGSVSGASYVGGLVGANYGSISNSYASGNVSGVSYIGGLVGSNYGSISISYATGNVTGSGTTVGGLVGSNTSNIHTTAVSLHNEFITSSVDTISNSYATGSVSGSSDVGGLVGYNTGAINNSYSAGSVSGSANVGGLVGSNSGTVSNSFWDTTASGLLTSAGGTGMTTAQMQTQANFTSGWNFSSDGGTWVMYEGYTYPLLQSFMTPLTVAAQNANITTAQTPYTGTAAATLTFNPSSPNFSNLFNADHQSLSGGTTNVTFSGTGTTAGNYTITPTLYSNQQGYNITFGTGTLTVTNVTPPPPPPGLITLTVTGETVSNKTYDGTTIATLTGGTIVGLPAGDTVTLNQSGTFASKNVATGIPVTATDTLSGALASDFTLVEPTGLAANITPAPLTVAGLTGTNRVYNGSMVDALSGTAVLSGLVAQESLTLGSTATGTLASPNAGNQAVITAVTIANGTGLASNYALTQPNLTANITPAPLTVTGLSGTSRPYNGSTVDALSGTPVLSGLVAGESLTLGSTATGTLASANAGNEAVSTAVTIANNGNYLASNYALTQPTGLTANITPAPLTVTGLSGTTRPYNGSTSDALSGTPVLSGLVAGESLTLSGTATGTLASPNAGNEAVSTAITIASNGNYLASNYVLTQPTGLTASITPAVLTLTGLSGTSRPYNGSTADTLSGTPILSGLVTGESLTLSGTATGTLASANVGSEPVSTAITIANNGNYLASNYVLAQPTLASANITMPQLSVLALQNPFLKLNFDAFITMNDISIVLLLPGSGQGTGTYWLYTGGNFGTINSGANNGNATKLYCD
jgi:filamentous hemagglutinin family protein